jgi:menaquinone-dependent protoporphyrinogen oxidase
MRRIGVFYATREGHTRSVAERVAADLRARGFDAAATNVRDNAATASLEVYWGAVVAASVHGGKHEREMVKFIKSHVRELNRMPTAFLSVTLSEAGAERPESTAEERAQCKSDVQTMIENFFKATGWRPKLTLPVAGALLYSRYNFVLRFVMKRIAQKMRAGTDTSRDYDYTDWPALDRFAMHLWEEATA